MPMRLHYGSYGPHLFLSRTILLVWVWSILSGVVSAHAETLIASVATENQQQSGTKHFLVDALEAAWRQHPQFVALKTRAIEADAAQELAHGLTPEPASLAIGNLSDRPGNRLGKAEWEVELAVPLWQPGQKDARTAEAVGYSDEIAARQRMLKLELAGEVREAWWNLALARSHLKLLEQRLETARSLASDVQKRFQLGELSRIDANLAQSDVLAAETEQIESRAALLQAEQTFQLLTGIYPPLALAEEERWGVTTRAKAATKGNPPIDSEAIENHPLLLALAAIAHTAWARVQATEKTPRSSPELALRLVRERGDFAESYNHSVGVRLKIPFSSGAQQRRNTSAAQAEAEQADAERRRAEIRVKLDLERARRSLEETEQQWTIARQHQTLASDSLRLGEKAFTLGEIELTSLLRLRSAAFSAENLAERARVTRMASVSRWNQSLGVLP